MPKTPPDPRVDSWIDITDFSPGIYSNTYLSEPASGTIPIIPAPPGSAQETGTFGCIALANGGLAPLPAGTSLKKLLTTNNHYMFGFVNIPLAKGTAWLYMKGIKASTRTKFQVRLWTVTTAVTHLIKTITFKNTTAFGKKIGNWGCPFPVVSRLSKTTTTIARGVAGTPYVIFPAMVNDTNVTAGHLYVFPETTSRTTYGLTDLNVSGLFKTGEVIAHQGRIVLLNNQITIWPPGTSPFINDLISFTTPSGATTFGTPGGQQEVFAPEEPYGYGAAGSISAGELFLVKRFGGGIVVTGDLNNPIVTYLGGVQPTGNIYGQTGQTIDGLIYCSTGQGAWLWNGGNTSQKISYQIRDDFWQLVTAERTPTQNTQRYFVQPFGELIYFSNNWIYNTRLNSWWRQSQSNRSFYFSLGASTNSMYAVAQRGTPSGTTSDVMLITKTVLNTVYEWRSNPIRVTENKYFNLREITIFASKFPASTNPTVEILIRIGTTLVYQATIGTATSTRITHNPILFRLPCNVNGHATSITLQIIGGATSGPGPIIHKIGLGIRTRQHLPAQL